MEKTRPKLCGSGGRFRATESLWGIGSKICCFNGMSEGMLGRLVRERGSFKSNLILGFDLAELAALTDIDVAVLNAGTGQGLFEEGPTGVLRDLSYSHLRFCLHCLHDEGFHSVLFQFPLFSHCLVHEDSRLQDRCPYCGAIIPYKLPSSAGAAFCCNSCKRRLWKYVRQRPHVDNPNDFRFEQMAEWSSNWMKSVLQFSRSATPLKRWVEERDPSKWASKGLAELDGVFTARALRNTAGGGGGYWGGRCFLIQCDSGRVDDPSIIYSAVRQQIADDVGLQLADFGHWLAARQTSVPPNDRNRCSFAAWRAFWEQSRLVAELTGTAAFNEGEKIDRTFREYFQKAIVPGGFGASGVKKLNNLALREVLKASYVHAFNTFDRTNGRLQDMVQSLSATPLPIFLVKPLADDGVEVEWIHQKGLSALGRRVFEKKPAGF